MARSLLAAGENPRRRRPLAAYRRAGRVPSVMQESTRPRAGQEVAMIEARDLTKRYGRRWPWTG